MVNLPTWFPDCDSHTPVLLDFFLSFDSSIYSSICSTLPLFPLVNFDHVVVSVSIEFPINSKQDALFHCIAYGYSHTDCCGLKNHLRDVSWEDIFTVGASAAASEFCEWVQVGIKL